MGCLVGKGITEFLGELRLDRFCGRFGRRLDLIALFGSRGLRLFCNYQLGVIILD